MILFLPDPGPNDDQPQTDQVSRQGFLDGIGVD